MKSTHARLALPALGAAALLLTLSACSGASGTGDGGGGDGDAAGGTDCQSHALMITNVTGPGAVNGTLGSAGARVAVDYVNANGGVNGCELVLDIKDDGSDYTKALPMLQEAMATQDYDIVIPADFGASAVLPALQRAEQFTIFVNGTVGLTSPEETPLMFDSAVPSAYQAAAFAKWMVEEKGVQKVAVAVDNTSIGEAVLASFTAALEEAGGEVVAAESADLSSVNFTPVVQRLQGTGADSVFVNLFGTAGAYFVRDYQASGWGAPLYGGESVMGTGIGSMIDQSIIDDTGLILNGPAVATVPDVTEGITNLVAKMAANGEIGTGGIGLAAQPHDAIISFAWAANSIGSTDAAELATWLEDNGDTPVPNLAFSAEGTGYSPTNHAWLPKNSTAIVDAGPIVNGQYQSERLALLDPLEK